jgi:multiple sugar transport system permease protein
MMKETLPKKGRQAVKPIARSRGEKMDKLAKNLFMGPAILFLVVLLVFPVLYTVWQSFLDSKLTDLSGAHFIGLSNYWQVLTNVEFWISLRVTLVFTVLALVLQTSIGIGLAMLYNVRFFGNGFLRTLAIMPMAATPVSVALIFVMIYNPDLGVGNYLLKLVGLPSSLWTYSESSVIPSLVLIDTWQWTPLLMIIALAGLASLPADTYEAAKVDGSGAWQSFWHVTMPQLWPFIVSAIIFRLNDALKTFDIIYVMTQGGPGLSSTTLNIAMYNQAFNYYKTGYASAMSIIFFVIVMAIGWYFIRSGKKEEWK